MIPARRTPLVLLLLLASAACRPQADTATTAPDETTTPPDARDGDASAPDSGAAPDEAEPEAEPMPEASASTEVIEIGVADVGAAATITAAPERPAMPSMMSDISMAPSR